MGAGRSSFAARQCADVRPVERCARDFRSGRLSGGGSARSLRATRAAAARDGRRGHRVVVCAAGSRRRTRRRVRPEAECSPHNGASLSH